MAVSLRWPRIALWLVVILAVTAGFYSFSNRQVEKPVSLESAAWIGLPKEGMDASDYSVRNVISQSRSLSETCLNIDGPSLPETYIMTRPTELMPVASRSGWRIQLEVEDDRIRVARSEFPEYDDPAPFTRREVFYLPKKDLAALAKNWKTSLLWNSRQHLTSCTDSHGILFEACVDGKYGARDSNCGPVDENFGLLYKAVEEHILNHHAK